MNALKFTGKTLALCIAAGIAAAALCACKDKKMDDAQQQAAAEAQQTAAAEAQQTATEIDTMETLDMEPATEAEILEIFSFLPDPVATVDGEPIARKEIIDEIVSQGLPARYLTEVIGEEALRMSMTRQIEALVKDRLMLKLAEEAGFKPSAEFVIKEMKEEFDESSEEEQEEIKEYLKERGRTLEEHMKATSEDPEIQKLAALRKYTHTTFLDKAKKEVSDADVQKEYEAHIEELTRPEGITVAHILVQLDDDEDEAADKDAKAKIDAIYDELLKDPSKFAEIAVEKSDCPSGKASEGELPAFAKNGVTLDRTGRMDQTFVDAAFTLEKPGQITKPVKTSYGYHIIKLIETSPEEVVPLEKVKDLIIEHLVEDKANAELDKTLDEAMAKSAKIMDFLPSKSEPAAE